MARFSIDESIKFGFNTTKKNFLFFLGLMAIEIGYSVTEWFFTSMDNNRDIIYILIGKLIFSILGLWIGLGLTKVVLLIASKKKAQYKDIFSAANKIWTYFLATLLISLLAILIILGGGIVGLIGAGFIMAKYAMIGWSIIALAVLSLLIALTYISIRTQFVIFIILEQKIDAYEAIKKSFAMTRNQAIHLFVFCLAMSLVLLAGLLAFGVGLLVAAPTASLAQAYIYRKLANKS